MSEFSEKLKQPIEDQLNYQLSQLDGAVAEMEGQKEVVSQWPERKRRIEAGILKPIERWAAMLKRITRPINQRRYKREKKRLTRARSITWSHWRGFMAKSWLALLRTLNLVRILLVMGFSIGILILIGYLIVTFFGLIGGVG